MNINNEKIKYLSFIARLIYANQLDIWNLHIFLFIQFVDGQWTYIFWSLSNFSGIFLVFKFIFLIGIRNRKQFTQMFLLLFLFFFFHL